VSASESNRNNAGPPAPSERTTPNPGIPLKTCPVGRRRGCHQRALLMGLASTKPG
jgi:hypothetical protein